ncbi:MAG TPA: FAD-binding oxidoreductase [Micropepsaceae bacterium]|nr:FAD-binding oxidoreductase [Micropepsaceae bacterium]
MTMVDPDITARLKDAAGAQGWSEEPGEIAPHLSEWRGRWHGRSSLLLKPANTEAIARILAICNQTRTTIVPQGGNTGLVGGQIPASGEVLLSLERMNRIRRISADENLLIAEAGVVLKEIQRAASEAGRLFPLSLAAEGSCTIGGNISTNAGGVHVLRYGMMRDLVLGLEVVLANGSILDLMKGLRKDNTGYDLKQLFIGAEGTLGVITAAMLKLFPQPASYVTVLAAIPAVSSALPILNDLQYASGGQVQAFEIMQRRAIELVLREIPGTSNPLTGTHEWLLLIEIGNSAALNSTEAAEQVLSRAIERDLVTDAVFASSLKQREELWRLRESIPEAQRKQGKSIANDVSVPLARLGEFVDTAEAAVRAVLTHALPMTFGHAGDGNLHFAILAPDHQDALEPARSAIESAVQECVWRFNGSISAEHGIGIARREALARQKQVEEIATMAALKRALDPGNILNPGKLLPAGLP